jgi:epoxyqueuosine reductase
MANALPHDERQNAKLTIRERALALGFDTVGFTAPSLPDRARETLAEFIAAGQYGDMSWMADKAERRADPKAIWPEVQSVIMVGHSYAPAENPMRRLDRKGLGNISVYALNQDYHDVMKKRLKALAREIAQQHGCGVKVFVDTAPVMEKPLAEQAGLGWVGKHSCVVSREFGSWLFLGEIFTTLPLAPDMPHTQHCGTCTRCLDICPTQAFTSSGKLDATKCIAYLTIEHKGHIPQHFRRAIGNRVYGCDDCIAVCPWNSFAQASREMAYHPRTALETAQLSDLVQLDDATFRRLFSRSPVKRIGRDRFIRNVLIAIGNSADVSLLPQVEQLLADASPLVRAMAVWASGELMRRENFHALKSERAAREPDEEVRREWERIA